MTEDMAQAKWLLDWLRQREDEMAELLAELVAIPTENPPGVNYGICADVLEKRLCDFGLEVLRLPPSQRPESSEQDSCEAAPVLQASDGRVGRALHFHGHYDVVPAQSAEQFQPSRKEHFLFGRGSCDMKGGIVAMLYAIRALQECRDKPDGRIVLTLVPD